MRLRLATFFGAMLIGTISNPAAACRISIPLKLDDIRYADTVVIGQISNYRTILSPEATARWDKLYAPWKRPDHLMGDYVVFDVAVDEVLIGKPPLKLSVISMYGSATAAPAGPFLLALNKPNPARSPQGDSNAIGVRSPEDDAFALLEMPCSGSCLFES